MNKVVLTGKIAAMPSKEAFDAADDQGVRFDLVIVSQWQNSEEVHHEWFACVVHGKQAETFYGILKRSKYQNQRTLARLSV